MLLSLLLVTALAQATAVGPPPSMEAAIQLAGDGNDADALAMFQALAAADPGNHPARLWIARLHERGGHTARAEAVYRSVLLEDEASLEAMLGVARALLAQDQTKDAILMAERAEQLSANNAEVLALLGKAHAVAGHDAQSVAYYRKAAAAEPTGIRRIDVERARRGHDHRVDVRGFGEEYSGSTPDTLASEIGVNLRLSPRLRAFGRGEVQRKFSETEERGGGGVEWRWKPSTTLTGQALAGPGNDIMPRADVLGEIGYAYHQTAISGGVRYFHFGSAETVIISPAGTWWPSDRLVLSARYALSVTQFEGFSGTTKGHTAHLRGSYELARRVWADAGYSYGVEDFDNFSVDRIGDFRAHTGAAGVHVDLRTLTTVWGAYEYQRRTNGPTMMRLTLTLSQRF